TCRPSTPRPRPTTSSSASPSPTAAPHRRGCTCCRRCGSATPGRGQRLRGGPLLAVAVLEEDVIHRHLPGFQKRTLWFLEYRKDLFRHIALLEHKGEAGRRRLLLALTGRQRLERALRYLLDEREFLSPYGVRSLSAVYRDRPYVFRAAGKEYRVAYVPG